MIVSSIPISKRVGFRAYMEKEEELKKDPNNKGKLVYCDGIGNLFISPKIHSPEFKQWDEETKKKWKADPESYRGLIGRTINLRNIKFDNKNDNTPIVSNAFTIKRVEIGKGDAEAEVEIKSSVSITPPKMMMQ